MNCTFQMMTSKFIPVRSPAGSGCPSSTSTLCQRANAPSVGYYRACKAGGGEKVRGEFLKPRFFFSTFFRSGL